VDQNDIRLTSPATAITSERMLCAVPGAALLRWIRRGLAGTAGRVQGGQLGGPAAARIRRSSRGMRARLRRLQ
jgi:hypothetical protein